MNLLNNDQLNKTEVLQLTKGGILFYSSIIPSLALKNDTKCRPVLNPFYHDTNPGLHIYYSNGIWLFYDHGDNKYQGDVFNFAAFHFQLDIKTDFNLILKKIIEAVGNHDNKKIDDWIPPVAGNNENLIVEISLQERKSNLYTNEETAFWNQYGVDSLTLDEHRVVAIDGYSIFQDDDYPINHERPADQIWFAYRKGKNFAKIYCPSPKRFWYVGIKPVDYYFGTHLDFYPEMQDVILTGGEKDALTLIAHGFNAIALSSETANPSKKLTRDLYKSQMRISGVLYDLDSTGIKRAKELADQLNCPIITLPETLLDKGGKDVSDFFKLGGTVDEFNALIEKSILIPDIENNRKVIRTAQQRLNDAKNSPEIKMFFDVFLHSGELAILFGDTGVGKSILAVAIADAISRGVSLMGLQNQHDLCTVIYYDFELSDKQFQKRYSNKTGMPHAFTPTLYTDNIDFSELLVDRNNKFEQVLMKRIREHIILVGAKFIIIDNITFLSSQTSQDTQTAMVVMKMLKELKHDLDITILVLAHTPKRNASSGIIINDLAGSKHLSNFADSVFAIGKCNSDSNSRYLKQVKPSRSGEMKFDQYNVVKCELIKESSFLTFQFIEFCEEFSLLESNDASFNQNQKKEAIQLKVNGMTIRDIAKNLGLSKSKVGRWFS